MTILYPISAEMGKFSIKYVVNTHHNSLSELTEISSTRQISM